MTPRSIAVFVSPHGFGHAARAAAVMQALRARHGTRFQLFGSTPAWFFDESVPDTFDRHEVETDVGFRQRSSLDVDLHATVQALEAFLPFDDALLDRLTDIVVGAGCQAVLCDISPLGIAVAERAGLPSVLVENFLWPWLYEPLLDEAPGLADAARALQAWFDRATLHVQAAPACVPAPGAVAVPPVSRVPRRDRRTVRRALDVPDDVPLVVVTMGGIPQDLPFLDRLAAHAPVHFVVTGAPETVTSGTLRLFGPSAPLYMPDFVGAADAVVAKLGYGTAAEVWAAGCPFAWVARPNFREAGPLGGWVEATVPGFSLAEADFLDGAWLDRLPELLDIPPTRGVREGGAGAVADLVADLVA
ncbi:MAG: hypothetical protein RH859_02335 [Longimicrobiales bacterium]